MALDDIFLRNKHIVSDIQYIYCMQTSAKIMQELVIWIKKSDDEAKDENSYYDLLRINNEQI